MRGRVGTAVVVAGVASLLPAPAGAAASPMEVQVRSTVSGPALPAACARTGSESFPGIGADPGDPQRLTSVWLADGTRGAASSISTDGGQTWDRRPVPGATTCTGGPAARAELVNPRVAAGPGGRFWFGSSWISGTSQPLFDYGVLVHPFDGTAWQPGVAPGNTGKAQNVGIAPHPTDSLTATAASLAFTAVPVPPLLAYAPLAARVVASTTRDGGRTWSRAVAAQPLQPDRYAVEVRAVRAAGGAIVVAYTTVPLAELVKTFTGEPIDFTLHAVRSTDEGRTWSAPVTIGAMPQFSMPDPEGRAPAGSDGTNVAAVVKYGLAAGPDGAVWAAWADRGGAVRLARSPDGGRSWQAPRTALQRPAQPFEVALAVAGDGAVGLFFYDWTADVRGDGPLSTTPWLATSPDGQAPFEVLALDDAFDLRRTYVQGLPYDGGLSLGVTQGLTGLPDGFGVAYSVGPPLSAGPTDVRYAGVGPAVSG